MALDIKAIAERNYSAAIAALRSDGESYPRWFIRELHDLIGPLVPGRTTVVAARPGGGKTTLLLRQAMHLAKTGARTIYLGTESPGFDLQLRLTAWDLGLDPDLVREARWRELPEGAEEQVAREMERWRDEYSRNLLFASGDESTSKGDIGDAILQGSEQGFQVVIVDHLHEINWGSGDRTMQMGDGIRLLKDGAKMCNVHLLVAAQRHRDPTAPAVEDYLLPTQSSIKQAGAIEEVASFVLMPYRALKGDATPADIDMVRRGQKELADIADPNVMKLHIAKARYRGHSRDKHVKVYFDSLGRLHETRAEAERACFIRTGALVEQSALKVI